jgi:hypothetical protein
MTAKTQVAIVAKKINPEVLNFIENNFDNKILLITPEKYIHYNNKIEVNVVRMDTFLMENNIQIIDYLHCDAQGEDLKILKSFGNFISIIKKGKIEVTLKDELFSNTSNHIDDVVHFLNTNEFEIINWREIDMNRKDIYRYDGNVEFCKKNTKNLI